MTVRRSPKVFSRFLDTNGDGTGDTNAIGDYATTPTTFYHEFTRPAEVARMIISIEDSGGMTAQEYGNLNSALANGIVVSYFDTDTDELEVLTPEPIKSNFDWGAYCYDVDRKDWGAGNDMMLARWTFAKAGEPLRLDAGQRIQVAMSDSMVGLVNHKFLIQGID